MTSDNIVPYIFSVLSIIFYTILTFPQIYTILKLKSSDSVSILTLFLWCIADTINLLGVILLNLEKSLLLIGWYHLIMSYTLMIITILYNHILHLYLRVLCILIIFIEFSLTLCFSILLNYEIISWNDTIKEIGYIFGWISVFLFVISRLPQIYLNIKNKTIHGLSIYMFIFTILGNLFYSLSILTVSIEYNYIMLNLPWLILCAGCSLFDIIIIVQCHFKK